MLSYQNYPHLSPTICSTWDKGYRYGFNGKEIDKGSEGMGGGGSTYDYGFRIYNPSLGKFLSVDPLTASYPWYTPYQFAGNMPINCIDLDGLEQIEVVETTPRSNFIVNANITITMTYMQVTSGNGAVHGIDAKRFNDKYNKGNQTILFAKLPGPNNEPEPLEGRNLRLGMKAMKGNQKAINKLKSRGISNIFVGNIQFKYSIIQSPNTTLEAALTWMNENKQGRGIIMEQIPDELMKNEYGKNLNAYMEYANKTFKDNTVGGVGSNEQSRGYIDNYIILPKFTTMKTSKADVAVHEAGHNSAFNHLHTKDGKHGEYEYWHKGLQNNGYSAVNYESQQQKFNDGADCFPTRENVINILKDKSNRGTSATMILIED